MAGRGGGPAGGAVAGGASGKRAAGHVPRPMYEPINTSAPSKTDLELDAKLEAFMADNVPVMTSVDLRRREQVLGKIRTMFLQVCMSVVVLLLVVLGVDVRETCRYVLRLDGLWRA